MKTKRVIRWVNALAVLIGCTAIGFFAYELVKLTQEVQADESYGAKMTKTSDKPNELPKEAKQTIQVNTFKENSIVRPIKVEHGEEVTKEELMKYSWVGLDQGMDEEFLQNKEFESVHIFTEQKRKIITFDKKSGKALNELDKETGKELPPGENLSIIGYTMTGNEFREEVKMHDKTLSSTFKVYWVEDKIVFTPFDEYDHKEERQTIYQPVEFIEENEFVEKQ